MFGFVKYHRGKKPSDRLLRSIPRDGYHHHCGRTRRRYLSNSILRLVLSLLTQSGHLFREYSIEDWAELVQTQFADSQPGLRASRPGGLVELKNI